jgi:AraC family transcriptional regulator, activator of mtrCDE
MALISRLLSLMPVSGRLDARRHFGAPWRIEVAQADACEIPYHVLVSGVAVVEDEHGADTTMHAGDIVLFGAGGEHVLHDGSGETPGPIERHMQNGMAIETNYGDGVSSNLLCGRFLLPTVPQRLFRESLPPRLIVKSAREGDTAPEHLLRLIALMRDETLEARPGSEACVNHLSGALFALTLRYARDADTPLRGLLALTQHPRLQPAINAMFEEPGHAWTLPELAALCHMSRATFARRFDETIGCSAASVLTEVRMSLACGRLAQSSEPVSKIGESVGYRSHTAFQRVFKRQLGMTPAQWRAAARA